MSSSSSSSSSSLSQASPKANGEPKSSKAPKSIASRSIKHVAQSTNAQDVFLFLLAFRLLNALTVRTFFQPDEYFQSLEPAWALAFGESSGAWITWEWKTHLRSAIHPAIFAVVYRCLNTLAELLRLPSNIHGDLLLAGPKTLQAVCAAVGDYYTWKLGERIYGRGSVAAWTALLLTIASPWQWFVSTRTLSNCLETTLTIVALYNWPWHWSLAFDDGQNPQVDDHGLRIRDADSLDQGSVDETTLLQRSLRFAALATILRPTNLLIWVTLALVTFIRSYRSHSFVRIPWTERSVLVHYSAWSIVPTQQECLALLQEGFFCGAAVLILSLLVDRAFYGVWTFPPVNFLYFNVVQSLAVFYGNNNWHYYLSEGYPLLLTTALPFALTGIYKSLFVTLDASLSTLNRVTLQNLAILCLVVPAVLSVISHKEVRFIYPLLPPLHLLSAPILSDFFASAILHEATHPKLAPPYRLIKRFTLGLLLLLNITIAIYTTTIHNSGVITVTDYLRNEFTSQYLHNIKTTSAQQSSYLIANMTVAFLMPCHSTPWRSHLQYPPTASIPGISAWALTCEPPLDLTPAEKAIYKDEADIFYDNPSLWLRSNMIRAPPVSARSRAKTAFYGATHVRNTDTYARSTKREWPEYFVFFEQLEGVVKTSLRGSGYAQCKGGRIWNSAWHDDWRRNGDVLVWCLDKERQAAPHEVGKAEGKDEGPLSRLKSVAGLKEVAPAVDDSAQGTILGGGLGPWGIGGNIKGKDEKLTAVMPGLLDRVVEKPFWKQRPPEPKASAEKWWYLIPGLAPKRKKSWWERVMDAAGV